MVAHNKTWRTLENTTRYLALHFSRAQLIDIPENDPYMNVECDK